MVDVVHGRVILVMISIMITGTVLLIPAITVVTVIVTVIVMIVLSALLRGVWGERNIQNM
jgi:hypothetical protein